MGSYVHLSLLVLEIAQNQNATNLKISKGDFEKRKFIFRKNRFHIRFQHKILQQDRGVHS